MGRIWTDEYRLSLWLSIEVAVCEGWAQLGQIPPAALENIKAKAAFSWERVQEIEKITNHDVLAFTTNVAEYVGADAKYIHLGLTSSDVLDTALALQLTAAADLLLARVDGFMAALREQALEHKYTLQVGRTHGVHAEPVTFGLKFALWHDEMRRQRERLRHAREDVRAGKISGAVGTFANVDPRVEEHVCRTLGLTPAPVSTQIIQRDRHAFFVTVLAGIGATLDKIATELRNLQRTDIYEAEEAFARGQKGSSAMPHKKNPITGERISGMARLLRGYALTALENVALWHERDISHSSAERVILPDATITLDYMLAKATALVRGLRVFPGRMLANMEKTGGLIFSQRVLLALVDKGLSREDAYALTQKNTLAAWEEQRSFRDCLLADAEITERLSAAEIAALFDYEHHTARVDEIFRRAGLAEPGD
jgi:adenylosuccinate lyase